MPTTHQKILTLENLASKVEKLRQEGKRIVLCHGTFDLLHIGHIRHLQSASKEGDVLIATITGDIYVNKGPGRPVFNEHLRSENLAALACVDFISINQASTATNVISKVKPQVYVKGKDYKNASDDVTGNITRETEEVEKHGGKVIFTEDITFSSSNLINENFGIFSPETKSFLAQIRQKHKDTEVIQLLKNLSQLKVAVVGDAIIDEYYYTTLLGQSGKGTHPSVKYESKELFAGGSLAVANHLAGFVDSVTLATGLGTGDNYEDFIRSKLNNNITPRFYYFDKAPTVVKRRYVDGDLTKLFEVYIYNDQPSLKENDHNICAWLQNSAHNFDIVFVPDFGNGFVSQNMVRSLCDKSRFLAVNTQVNSGNRGYHVINRYPRADFVSLNGAELRLATHNRHDALENLAEQTADNLGAKYFAVTLGSKGAILLDREAKKTHNIPVLSTKVLDRVGAGDTLLALTGLCLGGGFTSDTALFVGSAAAALEVQIVCNREPIKPENLFKYISTLLK